MAKKCTRRGNTQETYRLGLGPTGAATKPENGNRKAGELSGHALTYKAEALPQGARRTARGFTLIELLVVVLIIGILVAVALPQYQKAVEKARWTEVMTVLNAFERESKIAFLADTMPDDGADYPEICEDFEAFSGGEWDEHTQWYFTKNFKYKVPDCNANKTSFEVYRINDEITSLEADFYSNGTKWISTTGVNYICEQFKAAYGADVSSRCD